MPVCLCVCVCVRVCVFACLCASVLVLLVCVCHSLSLSLSLAAFVCLCVCVFACPCVCALVCLRVCSFASWPVHALTVALCLSVSVSLSVRLSACVTFHARLQSRGWGSLLPHLRQQGQSAWPGLASSPASRFQQPGCNQKWASGTKESQNPHKLRIHQLDIRNAQATSPTKQRQQPRHRRETTGTPQAHQTLRGS